MNKSTTYYPYFDWLRIILAITVTLSHTKVFSWRESGNLCVQVFFALSGWLIGSILLNTDKSGLPRFFYNRVTRIWSPYAAAIVLLISASLLKDNLSLKWAEFIFYKITFVYNLFGVPQLENFRAQMPLQGSTNHFWSICAEEQFYLLAPLLIVLLPKRLGTSIVLWVVIAVLAITQELYGSIAIGVTAAVIKYRYGQWHLQRCALAALSVSLICFTALLYLEWWSYTQVAPFFSITLVLLLARPGNKTGVGEFFGGISYPFYLNQWIGFFAAHKILEPFGLREAPVSIVLGLLLNLAVAAVLYFLVDYPIKKNRSSWFTQTIGVRSAYVAYSLMVIGLAGGIFYNNRFLNPSQLLNWFA